MAHKGPGKSEREGISLTKLIRMFPDDDAARKWFEAQIWPEGPVCPKCGTLNVQPDIKHPTMTHRCRECPKRPMFSLKTGTLMQGSKLGYQKWAIAVYIVTTNLKGVSSMKLHRDLEVTQPTAWHLAHRIRETWKREGPKFAGPVEADETYVGGKRRNMSNRKRKELAQAEVGRGPVGKAAVVGVKDRDSNQVVAQHVSQTDAETLQGFVRDNTETGATVYTDEASAYIGLGRDFEHESVKHSVSEYVREQAHVNGMESMWSSLKRGFHGVYHKMSPKHLDRYVTEFAGRHNDRSRDTIDQMQAIAAGMVGKRLRYQDLIADNGLPSGARS